MSFNISYIRKRKTKSRFLHIPFTISIMQFLRINILFIPVLISAILGRYITEFIIAYFCAAVHESAHIYMAKRTGIPISGVEIQPFGICVKLKNNIIPNPLSEIKTAFAGPFVNLIMTLFIFMIQDINNNISDLPIIVNTPFTQTITAHISIFFLNNHKIIKYFTYCNLGMAIINLMPVLPLDGGRILRAALSYLTSRTRAQKITVSVSRIPVIIIISAAVYGLLTLKFNFSLILISAFILSSITNEEKNTSRITINEMLNHTSLINQNNTNKPKRALTISAHQSTPARFILRYLNTEKQHIVFVTDDYANSIKILTDKQIINSMSEKGYRITLKDIT